MRNDLVYFFSLGAFALFLNASAVYAQGPGSGEIDGGDGGETCNATPGTCAPTIEMVDFQDMIDQVIANHDVGLDEVDECGASNLRKEGESCAVAAKDYDDNGYKVEKEYLVVQGQWALVNLKVTMQNADFSESPIPADDVPMDDEDGWEFCGDCAGERDKELVVFEYRAKFNPHRAKFPSNSAMFRIMKPEEAEFKRVYELPMIAKLGQGESMACTRLPEKYHSSKMGYADAQARIRAFTSLATADSYAGYKVLFASNFESRKHGFYELQTDINAAGCVESVTLKDKTIGKSFSRKISFVEPTGGFFGAGAVASNDPNIGLPKFLLQNLVDTLSSWGADLDFGKPNIYPFLLDKSGRSELDGTYDGRFRKDP